MIVDKLFRREPTPNMAYATVLHVDARQQRVKVQGRNGTELWASYLPLEFEGLGEGQTVAVASSGGSTFLVRRVTDALPSEMMIQEV